jgi:hypothetical protein
LPDTVPVKKKKARYQNEKGQPEDDPYRLFPFAAGLPVVFFSCRHISIIGKNRGIRKMTGQGTQAT